MAHFPRIRAPGAWLLDTVLLPAEMEQADAQLAKALNGDDGGTWAPIGPIVLGGAGVTLNGANSVGALGSLQINGSFAVNAGGTFFVNAGGTFLVNCAATFAGALSATSTSHLVGAVTADSGIHVTSAGVMAHALVIDAGGFGVTGNSSITGNMLLTGGLHVTSTSFLDDAVTCGNGLTVAGASLLHATGASHLDGAVTTNATLTITAGGLVVTAGGATITAGNCDVMAGDLHVVAGNATIGGTLGVTGLTTLGLLHASDTQISATLTVSGATQLQGNVTYPITFASSGTVVWRTAQGPDSPGFSFGPTTTDCVIVKPLTLSAGRSYAVNPGGDGNALLVSNLDGVQVITLTGTGPDFPITLGPGHPTTAELRWLGAAWYWMKA